MASCYTHCTGHCYNDQCLTYVAPNGVWDYTKDGETAGGGADIAYSCGANTSNPFPTGVGGVIYNENVETLRRSINDERVRRGLGAYSWTPTPIDGSQETTPGDLIYGTNAGLDEAILQMKTAINNIRSIVSFTISDGNPVRYTQINELKTDINALRSECICNTDCGLNAVCSCYTNCGCKYSGSACETNVPCITY